MMMKTPEITIFEIEAGVRDEPLNLKRLAAEVREAAAKTRLAPRLDAGRSAPGQDTGIKDCAIEITPSCSVTHR